MWNGMTKLFYQQSEAFLQIYWKAFLITIFKLQLVPEEINVPIFITVQDFQMMHVINFTKFSKNLL